MPPSQRPPTAIELWYLTCFRTLRDHYGGRAPSITEFSEYVKRSPVPAYVALRSLERKGLTKRDPDQKGRFVITHAGDLALGGRA